MTMSNARQSPSSLSDDTATLQYRTLSGTPRAWPYGPRYFWRLLRFWQAMEWPQVPPAEQSAQDLCGITWIELYFWYMAWTGTRPPVLIGQRSVRSTRSVSARTALYHEDATGSTDPVPATTVVGASVVFAAASRRLGDILGVALWPGSPHLHCTSLGCLVPAFRGKPGLERRPKTLEQSAHDLLLDFLVHKQDSSLRASI